MKNFGIKSDLALDQLREDVYSISRETHIIKNGIKEFEDHSYNEYDINGLKMLSVYYEKTGSVKLKQVTILERQGHKVGYINYNENDLKIGGGKYELDYTGRIINKYHDGEIEYTNSYDGRGNISEVYYPNTGAKDLYYYDEKGLVIKQLSLVEENPLLDSLFGNLFGPRKKLFFYENDKWGNIISMKTYNAETNELTFSQKNTFNLFGDEIESIGYNGDGTVYSHVKYDYDYDDQGNWIKRRTLSKDNVVYRETIRTIMYHSQNLQTKEADFGEASKNAWRSKRLNGQELALLFLALSKNLFPRPIKGELLVQEGLSDGSCILYFKPIYYEKLKSAIRNAYNSGAFVRSNSEDDWNDFMYSIESAKIDTSFDNTNPSLKQYLLSMD